jgi:hypothetical protein
MIQILKMRLRKNLANFSPSLPPIVFLNGKVSQRANLLDSTLLEKAQSEKYSSLPFQQSSGFVIFYFTRRTQKKLILIPAG